MKIVGRLTNPRLEFKNLHKFVTLLVYFVTTRLHLTFIGGKFDRCIHAWICKFYSCTLYKNCIEKLFKLSEPPFSVGFMKGGKESKELCSVSGLGLRLHGRFSRNFVYCYMRVYLRRVLAVAEKKSLQLPQYWPERHHKLTVYATKGRIIFTCKSVLFFRVYQSSLDVTG